MLIMDHLQRNQPLFAFQWGFLEGRSTVTALLHLTEVGHDVCAVFLDFRKAFDSAPLTIDEKATLSWGSLNLKMGVPDLTSIFQVWLY